MESYVSVGVESTFGGGSSSLIPILVTSVETNIDRGIEVNPVVDNVVWAPSYPGKLSINGSITASVRPLMLLHLFRMLFGKVIDSGGYYTCTVGDPISGEIVISDRGNVMSYRGVGVIKCSLDFVANSLPRVNVKWIARDYENSVTESMVYTPEDPALPYLCDVTIERDGQPVKTVSVKTLTIEMLNDLDGDYYTVDDYRLQALIHKGPFTVTGSIGISGQDAEEIASAVYGGIGYSDLTHGNVVDVFTVVVTIAEIDGSNKMRFHVPVTYNGLAVGNNKKSKTETLKFMNVGDGPTLVVYK